MNFDLKRPCAKCPFRSDVEPYLRRSRAHEIARALDRSTFACHETTHSLGAPVDRTEQHCAGALIMLESEGRPSQMMRIAERLGLYDRTKLAEDSPVHDSRAEFIAHHGGE